MSSIVFIFINLILILAFVYDIHSLLIKLTILHTIANATFYLMLIYLGSFIIPMVMNLGRINI